MSSPPIDLRGRIAGAVRDYESGNDAAALLAALEPIIADGDAESLALAVEPWHTTPEIGGPVYERIVELQPNNARALVILANAWWLSGRGPDAVGELASRAISADPTNRGAWHLWALSEGDPRARTTRWQQVCSRFPGDDLARANFADNAASLAGAEHDPVALKLAIDAYETLLARATHPQQRTALEGALMTLRRWRP